MFLQAMDLLLSQSIDSQQAKKVASLGKVRESSPFSSLLLTRALC